MLLYVWWCCWFCCVIVAVGGGAAAAVVVVIVTSDQSIGETTKYRLLLLPVTAHVVGGVVVGCRCACCS